MANFILKAQAKFTSFYSFWVGPKSNENSVPPQLSIHHLIKAELQLWSFRLFTSRRKALWVDGCERPLKMQATPESRNSSKSYDFLPVSCQDDLYFNAKRSVVFQGDPKWQLHCEYLCSIFPATLLLEFCIIASTLLKVLMLRNQAQVLTEQASLNMEVLINTQ